MLIFVLILALNLLMPQMINWVNAQTGKQTISQAAVTDVQSQAGNIKS